MQAMDREMATIRRAIDLVAGGSSPRAVVGGLRFAEALLGRARTFAAEAGVRVVPLWLADDAGADIAIERIDG